MSSPARRSHQDHRSASTSLPHQALAIATPRRIPRSSPVHEEPNTAGPSRSTGGAVADVGAEEGDVLEGLRSMVLADADDKVANCLGLLDRLSEASEQIKGVPMSIAERRKLLLAGERRTLLEASTAKASASLLSAKPCQRKYVGKEKEKSEGTKRPGDPSIKPKAKAKKPRV